MQHPVDLSQKTDLVIVSDFLTHRKPSTSQTVTDTRWFKSFCFFRLGFNHKVPKKSNVTWNCSTGRISAILLNRLQKENIPVYTLKDLQVAKTQQPLKDTF